MAEVNSVLMPAVNFKHTVVFSRVGGQCRGEQNEHTSQAGVQSLMGFGQAQAGPATLPGRGANRRVGVRAVSPGQQDICPDTDCVNKGPFKNAHVPQVDIPSSPSS